MVSLSLSLGTTSTMSLTSIQDVSFWSGYNIDKIVGVFQGSYNKNTQTSTRSEPFIGTVYTYAIPHGFNRPVFPEVLLNAGNGWFDGGSRDSSGLSAIAISDATNIYIVTPDNSGTLQYKVIAAWIDGYDNSDPLIDEYHAPDNPVTFDSRLNYQKIYDQNVATYSAGTFGSPATVTVNHTLGYLPNVKAYFEPIAGEVWPFNAGGLSNMFIYSASQDEAFMQIYNNRVEFKITRYSNAQRRIWYKIYYDSN